MKKRYSFLYALLIIAVACGKKAETTKPVMGLITESVYASGNVKAADQYNVSSTVNGIMTYAAVDAGDSVNVGDTLFVLENVTAKLNSENARELLELSRENNRNGSARLEEIESGVTSAYQKFLLDSAVYFRQKKLWEQSIGSRIELEQKQLSYQTSRNSWLSADSRLAQLKIQLASELRRSEIGYDIAKKNAGDFGIRSNVSGVVFDVLRELNELVTPQTLLAVVGSTRSYNIELQVDEYDIVRIKPGQEVLVTMDSYKGQVFTATVTRIDPIMNERTRTFTVDALFVQPPPTLFPNLTVEANIMIQTRSGVLTIPRNYLAEDKYVYVSESEKREVVTGLMDLDKVEILSGLDSSTVIFLPPKP